MSFDAVLRAVQGCRSERPLVCIALIAAMICGVAALVYMTGGIKFVYSHSMYVPVVLAGFLFGVRGGLLAGLAGGLVLGPWMPIDTHTGEAQQTLNWLYRTGFFSLIGLFSGAASDSVRRYVTRLEWSALHDEATALPNCRALLEVLGARERTARRDGALVMIGVENSAELVSAFGVEVLDEVARQIAARLTDGLRGRCLPYRIDTDKLAVVLDGESGSAGERGMLTDLSAQFREPFTAGDLSFHGDVRLGCTLFDTGSDTPADILRRAHAALATSTRRALDITLFSPEQHGDTRENLQRLGELRQALAERQLTMHYQPKLNLKTGTVQGVEALMRWHHAEHGHIPPAQFIPRAELSTLIDPLTDFALDTSLAQLRRWVDRGMRLTMAVNISTRNLLQPGLAERVTDCLERHGLPPEMLELEVTEGALMIDIEATMTELAKLAGMRIVLSIDDFGTGYSSLQYLNDLPVTALKVDQAFVRNLPDDRGAAHIVEAAIGLAHRIGLNVVAEGAESERALDFLRDVGCDFAQGYHICRPIAGDAFVEWYQRTDGRLHRA